MYSCISSLSLFHHHLDCTRNTSETCLYRFSCLYTHIYFILYEYALFPLPLIRLDRPPVLLRVFLSHQLLPTGCPTYNICLFYTCSVKVF